jgi:hypothetical protein
LPSAGATDKILRYEKPRWTVNFIALWTNWNVCNDSAEAKMRPRLSVLMWVAEHRPFYQTKPRSSLNSAEGLAIKRAAKIFRCRMHGGASTDRAPRRAGAFATCSLEARALFCRGPRGAKACARAGDPKSRALETDASRLNGRCHGAWGSPAALLLGAAFGDCRTMNLPGAPKLPPNAIADAAWRRRMNGPK